MCDYILGRPPPLSFLSYTSFGRAWRAVSWRPWSALKCADTSPLKLEELKGWWPRCVKDGLEGFLEADDASLDVEPPGAVTRLHRASLGVHELLLVLRGEKEFLLFPPFTSQKLMAGHGTCDPDQSPIEPEALPPQILAGLAAQYCTVKAGETLLVPSGWWYWIRARAGTVTLRRSFLDACNIQEVMWHRDVRVEELRSALQPLSQDLRRQMQPEGATWLKVGSGPKADPGHFLVLHITVYSSDCNVLESSRLSPHPYVVEAGAHKTAQSVEHEPWPLAEVKRRQLLHAESARRGSCCGFMVTARESGEHQLLMMEIIDVLERAGPVGKPLRPVREVVGSQSSQRVLAAATFVGRRGQAVFHSISCTRPGLKFGTRRKSAQRAN